MINEHKLDSEEYYNPEFYKYASYDITSEYYPCVGEIISLFNSLENNLNECLLDYINNEFEDIGWIVISDLSFSNKIKLWKKLMTWFISKINNKVLQTHMTKKLEVIFKEIENKAQIRNTIAHADWENMNEKLFVKSKTKSGKDGVQHYYISINKEEFEKIIDEFGDVEDKLEEFDEEVKKIFKKHFS